MNDHDDPKNTYSDQLDELVRQLVVRARAGMVPRDGAAPPESIETLQDEFVPLIDFVVNGK